jgi:alpha-maltose-1-phosphate synthase
MRIAIASAGRFHLLDLARELDRLGARVRFYSYVPWRMARRFRLPWRCHVGLLPFMFPLVLADRFAPNVAPNLLEKLTCYALDLLVILRLRRCEVFICMSGIYLWAAKYARWRYGARIHLHRSSRHILSQRDILSKIPDARQVSDFIVARELAGYDLCDQIIVPSQHVAESFSPWPQHAAKIFLNPLGVDLDDFPTSVRPREDAPAIVLFVGQWSFRKGVDVLVEAIASLPFCRLIHVGALSDAPFPQGPQFIHHDRVPQTQLPQFYRDAHIFVLPSREDGFGVVLSQALASGLRVVCTDRTGGPDLARFDGVEEFIKIVPPDDVDALREAIQASVSETLGPQKAKRISVDARQTLSWTGYATRDLQFIRSCLVQAPHAA